MTATNRSESGCPLCASNGKVEIGVVNDWPIVQCAECALYYLDPLPSPDQLSAVYDDYEKTPKYLAKLRKKRLTAAYKLMLVRRYLEGSSQKFLDLGCNLGVVCEAARRQGFEAHGIDLDAAAISQAGELFPQCHFETISSYAMAERGDRFDLLYCAEVIEHVPEVHEFAASLRQLLRPGGVLYLTTPDAGHRKVPAEFIEWSMVIPPEHVVLYNQDNLRRLLGQHGFDVVRFRPCHRANMRVIARAR